MITEPQGKIAFEQGAFVRVALQAAEKVRPRAPATADEFNAQLEKTEAELKLALFKQTFDLFGGGA